MHLLQPHGDSPTLGRMYWALGGFLIASAVALVTHAALSVCPCGGQHR